MYVTTTTLDEYYNHPLFKSHFFCASAIVSKCILSEIICMLMDFSSTGRGAGGGGVGGGNVKNHVFGGKKKVS